eukprot:CAMPEP_0116145608 /NCGR_PEP_ID=MMETSP0329-20121206/16693_1 /TAXON_ID=697910 /ORGANISM="Pseudo-nitzschia arenysensis, Strain B593" /LENGTH=62 /DNA_ID=CAMNT_0003641243 /DNA_START=14 /DNA_END=198 /DNA_ORIENTATION=+
MTSLVSERGHKFKAAKVSCGGGKMVCFCRSASTKDDSRWKEADEKCLSRLDFHVSVDASLLL